jgi:hypothetical protein
LASTDVSRPAGPPARLTHDRLGHCVHHYLLI